MSYNRPGSLFVEVIVVIMTRVVSNRDMQENTNSSK